MIKRLLFKTKKDKICLKLSEELLDNDDFNTIKNLYLSNKISFSYEYINVRHIKNNFYPQIYAIKEINPKKISYLNEEIKKNFLRRTFKKFSNIAEEVILNNFAKNITNNKIFKKAIILQTIIDSDFNLILFSNRNSEYKKIFSEEISKIYPIVAKGDEESFYGISIKSEEIKKGLIANANQGVLVVNNFDKLSKSNIRLIKMALENKVIYVKRNKKTVSENSNIKLFAIANSKEARFVTTKPEIVREQIPLKKELLDYFNLIFVIRDFEFNKKEEKENGVLLDKDLSSSSFELNMKLSHSIKKEKQEQEYIKEYLIYTETLKVNVKKEYISDIAKFIHKITSEFQENKHLFEPNKSKLVKTFVRLAKANARINLRREVNLEDLNEAKKIIEFSLIAH